MRTVRITEVCVIIIVVVSLAVAGCGSGQPQVTAGAILPRGTLVWLTKYLAQSGLGHATSVDWALTTHGKAARFTGGADPSDVTPVYLFDVHGKFVWDHSCPPQAPRSSCVSIGTDQIFTVSPVSLHIIDITVQSSSPDVSKLGQHGHVSL